MKHSIGHIIQPSHQARAIKNSRYKTLVHQLILPKFSHAQHHMVPFNLEYGLPGKLSKFNTFINNITKMLELDPKQPLFFMSDECTVDKGETQREAGIHVDGCWGEDREHEDILMISSTGGCKIYYGEYAETPNEKGGFDNIDTTRLKEYITRPNELIIMNKHCLHESLPVEKDVVRQLYRINLPNYNNWKHYPED